MSVFSERCMLQPKLAVLLGFLLSITSFTLLVSADVHSNEGVAEMSKMHIKSLQATNVQQRVWPRRALQADLRGRPAPRGFPPPQGNALVNTPSPPLEPFPENYQNPRSPPPFPPHSQFTPPPHF